MGSNKVYLPDLKARTEKITLLKWVTIVFFLAYSSGKEAELLQQLLLSFFLLFLSSYNVWWYGLNVSPQNLYVETQIPKVFEDMTFGRSLVSALVMDQFLWKRSESRKMAVLNWEEVPRQEPPYPAPWSWTSQPQEMWEKFVVSTILSMVMVKQSNTEKKKWKPHIKL